MFPPLGVSTGDGANRRGLSGLGVLRLCHTGAKGPHILHWNGEMAPGLGSALNTLGLAQEKQEWLWGVTGSQRGPVLTYCALYLDTCLKFSIKIKQQNLTQQ